MKHTSVFNTTFVVTPLIPIKSSSNTNTFISLLYCRYHNKKPSVRRK